MFVATVSNNVVLHFIANVPWGRWHLTDKTEPN